ncbi:MAG: hypothetical protein COV44_08250 [Deltaproteobacteria bacterium CG11_big_fil_rev_8_21_14_0_20_45_16]|nr:MAG: hypothetical protein COV44_08250 [Deltaproteobacteria bacterium CG11_big_fil_rev_8_21_14_0_20_45_16]
MLFRVFLIASLFGSSIGALKAQTDLPEAFPLGVILRPSLLEKIIGSFNKSSSMPIDACMDNRSMKGDLTLTLQKAVWKAADEKNLIVLTSVSSMLFTGSFSFDCSNSRAERYAASATLGDTVPIRLRLDPTNLRLTIDEFSVAAVEKNLKIELPELPNIQRAIEDLNLLQLLSGQLASKLNAFFSEMLETRFRGLVYAESVTELFSRSEMWKRGVEINRGFIRLRNKAPGPKNRALIFAFFPRGKDSIFVSDQQIELYVNAVFFSKTQAKEILGSSKISANEDIVKALENRLKQAPAVVADAKWTRPLLPSSEADFSLFITEGLFNEALMRIYQENLTDFQADIDMGKQVKGLLTKDEINLDVRIDLGSETAPKLIFQPDFLSLQVSDYLLRLGAYIEDRLIPTTEIVANVQMTATPKIDFANQSVNLQIQADSFRISLDEETKFRKIMNKNDLRLIERITNEIWEGFFSSFPELILFPTLVQTKLHDSTQKPSVELAIKEVQVKKGMTLIDINLAQEAEIQ